MHEPPPRKAKLTQQLKINQLEQLSKIQIKHQQDCDLIDDIRNFGKQRSQIDKEYGQALQKLVAQYQKKDWPSFPEVGTTLEKPVLAVWKAILDATDRAAQARFTSSEQYKNNVYEAAKNCKAQKDIHLKKCQELINNLHNEVGETVKELAKAKKKYYDMEQLAVMAREKYQDINERLRKNQTSIFKSKSGLEKAFQKFQQKCDESNRNSTIARNDYLFMINAANAHQKRFYEIDMPEALRVLDGNLYSKLQLYLSFLNRYELDACSSTEEAFVKSLHCTANISREFNAKRFLSENPIFEHGLTYSFEPYGNEETEGKLQEEQPGNDNSLNREARKWTYRVEKNRKLLERLSKMKEGLEELVAKHTEHPEHAAEASTQETEVRLEKCKQDIRKCETERLQGEARLALLRNTNVNLEEWIKSAKSQLAKEMTASATTPRRVSIRRKPPTPMAENPYQNGDIFFNEDDEYDDGYVDEFDDTFEDSNFEKDNLSIPSSDHSRTYPVSCTVIYPYEASRSDELTISVGDKIEVIEDGDLDQWVKARDSAGRLGYVPEYYLEFPPMQTSSSQLQAYTIPPGEDTTSVCDSASTSTSGTSSLATTSSNNDSEVSKITAKASTQGICLAKAVYEYVGCSDEELTFPEGAIINVISKNDNGIDDGWWKGELNGKIGVFPGIVVAELGENIMKSDSPVDSPCIEEPPSFRPPPPFEPNKLHAKDTATSNRKISWDDHYETIPPSGLAPPEIRHSRATSAPASPGSNLQRMRPARSAPAPPQRPRSYLKS